MTTQITPLTDELRAAIREEVKAALVEAGVAPAAVSTIGWDTEAVFYIEAPANASSITVPELLARLAAIESKLGLDSQGAERVLG